MIKQVHNLLTVRDNLRTLKIYDKFDKISEFQNIISDRPPNRQRHYDALRTKIDM